MNCNAKVEGINSLNLRRRRLMKTFSFCAGVAAMSCLVPLSLSLLSTASLAACSVSSGGVSMNVTGTCAAPDGTYTGAGAIYLFNASAGTIENTGSITLQKGTSAVAEFVRAFGSGSQVLLNNLTIDPFTSSGGGTYGLHAGQGAGANIVVSGLYTMTGSGTVYGAAAGNLGTAGTITLNDVDINITGGTGGAGLITSTSASNILTVNGFLKIQNAATGSNAISVGTNSTINLYGSGSATNSLTMIGSGSTAMTVGAGGTLDATNLVTVTGTAAANISALTVNGANSRALLNGGLTANVTGTAVTASGGGVVTLDGTSSLTTSQNSAYGAYATGAGSQINLETVDIATTGSGATGLYATLGGTINISSSGNITTYGGSNGLYASGANSSITGNDLVISVKGGNNAAVYAISGSAINLTGGSVSMAQAGQTIISYSSNTVVNLANVDVTSSIYTTSSGLTAVSNGTINANNVRVSLLAAGVSSPLNNYSTSAGVEIYANGMVNFINSTILTSNSYGYGVRLFSSSTSNIFYMQGGSIYTGILLNANGDPVDGSGNIIVDPSQFVARGTNGSTGIYTQYGKFFLDVDPLTGLATGTSSSVNTFGASANGLYATGANSTGIADNTTITTRGNSSSGIAVDSSGSISLSNGVISTSGNTAYGAYATGSGSTITLADTAITTSGSGSYGIYAVNNGTVNLNGTGTSVVTVNGNAVGTQESFGVAAGSNGHITTAAGTTLNVAMKGDANGSYRTYGVLANGAGASVILNGTTNITTIGFNSFAMRGAGGGTLTVNGNLDIATTQGTGVHSTDSGTVVTLAGAQNVITVGSQSGSISNGLLVSNGRLDVNSATTSIVTTGANAYGIQVQYNVSSQLNLNGAVSIETNGQASHGFYLTQGAQYAFDGAANHTMPTFVINGTNSAVLAANGSGSLFTVTGTSALNMAMTPVAGTWGAKAEASGRVRFSGAASTGGTGLWASNGVLDLWGSADAAGSRVLLDTNATLNLESTGTSTMAIGSLEGTAGTTVNLYGHTLSIGSNNAGNNGTLVDNANFAGRFANAASGSLLKTGSLTQILSGTGNTVASVTVDGGTLSFRQAGAFTTSGGYTTQSGATTDIGQANSTLHVGGVFTQQAGSTLSVTVGASPDITAATAQLDGTLVVNGFVAGSLPVRASDVTIGAYTLIHTTAGITGNFTNNQFALSGMDYLLQEGYVSVDNRDYNLGFRLAWTDGGQAYGNGGFTLASGTAFDVDVSLMDQAVPSGGFVSGWDGRSLVKGGEGRLLLSAVNGYTGTTTITDGTLEFGVANSIATSDGVIVNGGLVDLKGYNQTFNDLSGTGGEIRLSGGAQLLADNGSDTTYAGLIAGNGTFVKDGTGMLTLTGSATHSGLTTIAAGTLSIGAGGTSGTITGNILNDATLIFDRSDDIGYGGVLSGSGDMFKQGGGVLNLTGVASLQGSVDVVSGTLNFRQAGAFTTSGDYTTRSGATTAIGFSGATLAIGGAFTQESGSTLNAILGASPDITASSASLDGTLIISGFSDGATPVTASAATSQYYIMIRTTGGISGDFDNNPLIPSNLDYLLHDGHVTVSGLDYELGFRLAWTEGGQGAGTGSFTLNDGTAFDVDIALDDQAVPPGGFASGWDGRSLVKGGVGRLVLSAVNGYTGTTTVTDGTLEFGIANSIATSSGVIVNGGLVDLKGYDQQFNRLSGSGGEIALSGAVLTAHNATIADDTRYDGTIGGVGTFVKSGAGSLTLAGATLWQGETHLEGGQLILDGSLGDADLVSNVIGSDGALLALRNGAVLTGSIDPADVEIDASSRWHMTASSEVATLTLAGTIDFSAASVPMVTGHTLTAHEWIGQGGTVVLNTVLGDDGSVSDRIVIDGGHATGTTKLDIRNAGGFGAQTTGDGILIVQAINGAQTTLDNPSDPSGSQTFRLSGRVAAGAYDYALHSGGNAATGGDSGDQNWYLRSYTTGPTPTPVMRPEVVTNSVILPLALEYGYAMLDTLHERAGTAPYAASPVYEERAVRCADGRQAGRCVVKAPVAEPGRDQERWGKSGWARLIGNRGFHDGGDFAKRGPDYDYTFGGIQAGLDIYAHEQADGTVDKAGIYVGYGQIASTVKGQPGAYYGGKAGSVDMDAYTLGGYWTHLAASGWYTDAVVQGTWYSADARSVLGQQISPEGFGFLASLEGGYSFRLGDGWTVEPQAQLVYQTVSFDHAGDAFGRFNFEDGDSLRGRVGVRIAKDWNMADGGGAPRLITAWVRGNIWHEFMGGTKTVATTFDGSYPAVLASRLGGTWGEIGAGISGQISENMTLFATGAYQHSFDDRGRQAWDGRVGITVKW